MKRELPKGPGIEEIRVHHCADGGLLYEFYREKGFGQLAVRTVDPGVTAGGHVHDITDEYWIFFKGEGTIYLEYKNGIREMRHIDTSKGPITIPLPCGTGHDVKCIGGEELVFIFFADRLYSAETHDKRDWEW